MTHNARMVCKEIQAKLDVAVAPNGYMRAFTTLDNDDLFFNDKTFLEMFLAKGAKERALPPDGCYYTEVLTKMWQQYKIKDTEQKEIWSETQGCSHRNQQ